MGERRIGVRRVYLPLKCSGCGCVEVRTIWEPERRSREMVPTLLGLCPGCRATYFYEGLSIPKFRRLEPETS